MIQAPANPSTEQLKAHFQFDMQATDLVHINRIALSSALMHPDTLTGYDILGACAATYDPTTLNHEGAVLSTNRKLQRVNIWKPRSDNNNWHGLETGINPDSTEFDQGLGAYAAYDIVHERARNAGNVALEVSFPYQVSRYGELATFVWLGARLKKFYTSQDGVFDKSAYDAFIDMIARYDPTLPVGVKNDLDGTLGTALERIEWINHIRTHLGISSVAPAVLIYRGGDNARSPQDWEKQARLAIQETDGRVIIDMAHGGEMAHHADSDAGVYEKSVIGQLACWDHAITLRNEGEVWAATMSETSDMTSPMDPLIPFQQGLGKSLALAAAA